ncbi:hypothetical protein LHU53_17965 [Rhodoferax sp. U2-2l]|uniref:PhaM family polyhydroxyalkanoate granule multifunctional regulatory protein n=1 Tax=Rhodoferax sp. U2-2l TaxID=2884000 RepID=UPI001D0AF97E|nr:PhaM family polyhydroxyalkanoate granule multifunctional regulatory protein [Rhodoferax sp. U2-2l]MCB8748784.1 hypothetical protein [Rhodoferax sp. U2-2l]
MSDTSSAGFAQFVPGFDFLQNLAKSTSQAIPQMPNMANWIAPTLSVEELDKRISELKAVHFWLDQNSRALAATVQALEVQKMTLATLKGMNFSMTDMANAFKLKAADTVASSMQKVSDTAAAAVQTVSDVAGKTEEIAKSVTDVAKPAAAAAVAGMADPMQLWTSLTHQFQSIAASAMAEAGKVSAMDMGKNMLKGAAAGAAKGLAKPAGKAAPAPRAAAKKSASRSALTPTAAQPSAKTAAKTATKKAATAAPKAARRR